MQAIQPFQRRPLLFVVLLLLLCVVTLHAQLDSPERIAGKLRCFDQTPHVAVPVQLLDRSNQVVQTQLSDATGGYNFTNVSPGTYRVRCQVLGGFRYHGLDR
ncbi:MAG: hypothetical protein HY043_04070, partial [Verrucomicrobia bacterium]|nr:hypothetical protein [Verrucomicrobiota bacterium]